MANEANPFESLQEQIDDASAYIGADEGVLERLKNPERVLETNLTVERDDGSLPLRERLPCRRGLGVCVHANLFGEPAEKRPAVPPGRPTSAEIIPGSERRFDGTLPGAFGPD
jgi:hypothetical protein